MGVANLYRSLALGLTLLLVPGLAMAQQAINPAVFQALTAAQKAQQNGDLDKAREEMATTNLPSRVMGICSLRLT